MHEADKSVTELSVMHQEACKPLRVLQKLEPKVAIIMEKWRAKDNETCDDDDLDFTYLAQLILDGHKIIESTKQWHLTRLEIARSIFKAEESGLPSV
ncbi:hypothetical protein DDE83_006771 [Stemphylium lycopersici]|uniref:Uncharacterized protein n=1 Tax=Stemphylium lycopersici TaxID=183478 RepID=A0A364MXY6_STELY|nr:hypothetical protein DDE83_006771 [Stemphylium lycopersici]